jgi:hypothetical protein
MIDTTKVVVVEWLDAQVEASWEENVKAHLAPCTTVGFVISETKDAICIASTWAEPHSNCRIHIPKKWITSRKYILIGDENESASVQAAHL